MSSFLLLLVVVVDIINYYNNIHWFWHWAHCGNMCADWFSIAHGKLIEQLGGVTGYAVEEIVLMMIDAETAIPKPGEELMTPMKVFAVMLHDVCEQYASAIEEGVKKRLHDLFPGKYTFSDTWKRELLTKQHCIKPNMRLPRGRVFDTYVRGCYPIPTTSTAQTDEKHCSQLAAAQSVWADAGMQPPVTTASSSACAVSLRSPWLLPEQEPIWGQGPAGPKTMALPCNEQVGGDTLRDLREVMETAILAFLKEKDDHLPMDDSNDELPPHKLDIEAQVTTHRRNVEESTDDIATRQATQAGTLQPGSYVHEYVHSEQEADPASSDDRAAGASSSTMQTGSKVSSGSKVSKQARKLADRLKGLQTDKKRCDQLASAQMVWADAGSKGRTSNTAQAPSWWATGEHKNSADSDRKHF